MIKHIAMFRFKSFESEEKKIEYYNRIKDAFRGLEEKVPAIQFLQLGFDELHSEASFDLAILVDIEDLDALSAYANHPEHIKAAAVIKEFAIDRKVIDFQV